MSASSIKPINNNFKGKDIVSFAQFDTESIQTLFQAVQQISTDLQKGKVLDILKGTLSTLLFYEPSSRTMGSFDSAIKRLGGETIVIQNPQQFSSVAKGETLEDTIRVFEAYSDLIIMRHPEKGAAQWAANAATESPVINAGDGPGEHPTQALLDLYTIYERFGRLENLTILCAGDLLYGRTIHSLLQGLALYRNNKIYLLSPEQLRVSREQIKMLKDNGLEVTEISSEEDMPKDANVWYWTRVQKERFTDYMEYERLKHRFVITPELLQKKGNDDMIMMHPLPRVGEIDERIDADPRAWYLPKQVKNGMYVRMGLVSLVLGKI